MGADLEGAAINKAQNALSWASPLSPMARLHADLRDATRKPPIHKRWRSDFAEVLRKKHENGHGSAGIGVRVNRE
jgi:hypothetical protein